jgi:predicted amidohydrolase YtcJ
MVTQKRMHNSWTVYIILILFSSCTMNKQKVDLIVHNGTVYTCDTAFSTIEAFAVLDGKIIETGSNSDILSKYKSDSLIDAYGKFILPGFYDAHCHFLGYGLNKESFVDLGGTMSEEEAIQRIIDFSDQCKTPWIMGRGWDQNKWDIPEFPDCTLLDEAFPDIPVFLIRIDGHAAWVNTKAMKIAGITADTKIEGGKFLLSNGKPSGILIDEAMELVRKHIPKPDIETKKQALLTAQKDCFSYGLTTVADAGLSVEEVLLIDSLHQTGDLKIRIYAMLEPIHDGFEDFVKKGVYITDRLSVRAIKLYADGALGSRGACLLDEYSDDPGNKGVMVNSREYITKYAEMAKENGWQLCIHAIGDSANREILKIYGEVLGGTNDLRWRIEHAQVINPDDFHMFGEYNIIPSIQTTHCTSDMYWAEQRLGGTRIQFAYAWRLLLEQNGWLCNGTDFPVEQINPFLTFYAGITRKDISGFPENGFYPEQLLSRKEMLWSMTLWAARAGFEEDVKGSLEAGKWADFVILDLDPMNLESKWIPEMEVVSTWVAGKKVYGK